MYAAAISASARMPSGYGDGPKICRPIGDSPCPMSRIVRIAGRPRYLSV
jgi:hypothetical protein